MQTILGCGSFLDQLPAMLGDIPQFADWWRGHPDGRQQVGSQQFCQDHRIVLIGLTGAGGDQFEFVAVGHQDAFD